MAIASGPKGHPLLGNLPLARRDPLKLFVEAFHEYGDVVRFRFGPMIGHMVSSARGVQHVLVDNARNYGKQTRGYKNLRYVLGDGLLTAEGETWKRHRRIAQPAFHRQRVHGFAQSMVRAAEDASVRLQALLGREADLSAEMGRITLRIVGETLLGHDPTAHAGDVGESLGFLLRLATERSARVIDLPPLLPTRENRKFRASLAKLDRIVLGMIEERRKDPADRGDLLSMLMLSRDEETGSALDDRQLRDEAMTIFLAGHETTANALTFTLLLLAQFPPAARALRAELAAQLQGRSPTLDDLAKLPLLKATVEEALRLYPPAWMIARSATGADEIDGFTIPGGSIVFVSPFVVHRSPRLWSDPEGFDPQRFLEGAKPPPRGAYFPFGAGPRQCIGNAFALMEAQLVLATLLPKLRFETIPGYAVDLEPSITLRPRHGLKMAIRAA